MSRSMRKPLTNAESKHRSPHTGAGGAGEATAQTMTGAMEQDDAQTRNAPPRPSGENATVREDSSGEVVAAVHEQQLANARENGDGEALTTDQGLKVSTTDNSLRVGVRGPSLLEDFHLREKMMRFDHERIPERVVHARGSGAHGYFQVYEPMGHLSKAGFLQNPGVKTPVFVRFSTVAGSRGSTDMARDVRGFAVRFYTDEGNFDLVGNNMPVFFIQDAIKFPDLIHAVKPEPPDEIPQAATAHDTSWDFFSLDARIDAYGDVGHVRSSTSAKLPHDGRLWGAHLSAY